MFESLALDVSDFNVEHSPQVLGLFEPINAVMFLNVTDERFDAWRADSSTDDELTETFWHEAYHCFQVYATGFCFDHCLRLAHVIQRETSFVSPALRRLVMMRVWTMVADRASAIASSLWSPHARAILAEARRLQAMARHAELVMQEAQRHDQSSIWGSLHPQLHASLNNVGESIRVPSSDGVSAEDVIEGAALLYGRDAVTVATGRVVDLADLEKQTTGPYHRLVSASLRARPDCSSIGIRLAAALALRYAQPGAAFLATLSTITEAARGGSEKDAARALARALPLLPGAGPVLGTAAECRAKIGTRYRVYDRQLNRLQGWKIDELDLLADQDALAAVPPGELGFTLVTKGGPRGKPDPDSGHSAVAISALLLPNGPGVAALRRGLRDAITG